MRIDLIRFHDDGDTTCGLLYIDDVFECFIVEDQENTVKKYGETRIPEGVYDVSLRKEGTFHQLIALDLRLYSAFSIPYGSGRNTYASNIYACSILGQPAGSAQCIFCDVCAGCAGSGSRYA